MTLSRWALLGSFLLSGGCADPYNLGGTTRKPLAAGTSVSRVAFYQGVGVDVVVDGAFPPYRNAPIIQGKDTLVRVYVDVDESWTEREIVAVLGIQDQEIVGYESSMVVSADSTEADLSSTFNFDLPADLLTLNSTYSVAFYEVSRRPKGASGSNEKARFPSAGFADLAVQPAGEIEIVLIPFQYNGDGSGRVPDTSQPVLDTIYQRVSEMYPTSKLTLTVAPVQPWSRRVSADGSGWSELLNEVAYQRSEANVPENTYYYAYFKPANSFEEYCSRGCVLGLSSLGTVEDSWSRASMGVAFNPDSALETANTIAHEVGHAHGREHAPCGLGGQPSDINYPYWDGSIGLQGYESTTGELQSPNSVSDVMSYCNPAWVSDYTYRGLFDRITTLQASPYYRPPDDFAPSWRSILVEPDGSHTEGRTFTLSRPPGGTPRVVDILDDSGEIIGTETGFYYPYTHIEGGTLLLPEATPVGSLRIQSQR